MSDPANAPYSRRLFIQQGVTLASLASTVPYFIQQSAFGMMRPLGSMVTSLAGVPEDRVLVVVQLGGGNDGLNTVVPYGERNYYTGRPSLAIRPPGEGNDRQPAALQLDGVRGIGLHPNLTGMKELIDEGVASIVQGVGYPNPNRSHFTSMDIWHTASTNANGDGWIGRYFDNTCNGTPIAEGAVAIGRETPLAMIGRIQKPVAFESADLFRWLGNDLHTALEAPYREITRAGQLDDTTPNAQRDFLTRTALDAQVSSERIRAAVAKSPLVRYPNSNLARQLRVVGAMIRDGMATRVYYVSIGGFDTHAGQAGPHGNLMRQIGDALNAFHKDLTAQGNSGRVLTAVFSEFGRRVGENGSGGTDHGTAAPMYFVGDMVRPGVLGDHPSLTDLDRGDLKFTVDFRSVYASLLEDWMGAPAAKVLGKAYPRAKLLK